MSEPSRKRLTALVFCLGVLSAGMCSPSFAAAQAKGRADFGAEPASDDARQVADLVIASGDDHGLPFVIVDKVSAKVFVFYPDGRIRGAAPALLGLARGDDSVPGIGHRKLSSIRPGERTTPAGRFVARLGNDLGEKDVVWVDYDAAVSLHRVITTKPKERRLQRLATATPLDNRISYGCINVPADFFDKVVRPAFAGTDGIVYILPEVRSIHEVFAAIEDERGRQSVAADALSTGPAKQSWSTAAVVK